MTEFRSSLLSILYSFVDLNCELQHYFTKNSILCLQVHQAQIPLCLKFIYDQTLYMYMMFNLPYRKNKYATIATIILLEIRPLTHSEGKELLNFT